MKDREIEISYYHRSSTEMEYLSAALLIGLYVYDIPYTVISRSIEQKVVPLSFEDQI